MAKALGSQFRSKWGKRPGVKIEFFNYDTIVQHIPVNKGKIEIKDVDNVRKLN